jgi:hypothetical protein
MTGLLDLLGQAACREIAFNAESAGYCQCVLRRGLIESAHGPKGVRAVLSKSAVVKADVVGLDRFGAHGVIIPLATIVGKLKSVSPRESEACLLRDGWEDTHSAADDFGAVYAFGGVAGVYD